MEKHRLNKWNILFMIFGNIVLGMGVAAFKLSRLGNDPFTGMAMALAELIHMPYANFLVLLNLAVFVVEFLFGRKYIGIGTFFNALLQGYIVTFFYEMYCKVAVPQLMWQRLLTVVIGLTVGGIGLAMYQNANAGASPYDSLSMIMTDRGKHSYYAYRMSTDLTSLVFCFLAGGIVNVGTVACVLLLGPIADFVNLHFIKPFMEARDKQVLRKMRTA